MRSITGFMQVGVVAAGLAVAGATAGAQSWAAALSGSQQVPANASTGGGFSRITMSGNLLHVQLSWSGVVGGPVAAGHIHCCTAGDAAGQNTGVALPFADLDVATSGTYDHTFDLLDQSVYTAGFLSVFGGGTADGARAALVAGLDGRHAYVNLHNATYPGGEIRGNVALVPEPATFALAAAGMAGVGLVARRRRGA